MISAVLGIAIVALPAGIIIAGYQNELEENRKHKEQTKKHSNKRLLGEALCCIIDSGGSGFP